PARERTRDHVEDKMGFEIGYPDGLIPWSAGLVSVASSWVHRDASPPWDEPIPASKEAGPASRERSLCRGRNAGRGTDFRTKCRAAACPWGPGHSGAYHQSADAAPAVGGSSGYRASRQGVS